jgi:hypothetical protein
MLRIITISYDSDCMFVINRLVFQQKVQKYCCLTTYHMMMRGGTPASRETALEWHMPAHIYTLLIVSYCINLYFSVCRTGILLVLHFAVTWSTCLSCSVLIFPSQFLQLAVNSVRVWDFQGMKFITLQTLIHSTRSWLLQHYHPLQCDWSKLVLMYWSVTNVLVKCLAVLFINKLINTQSLQSQVVSCASIEIHFIRTQRTGQGGFIAFVHHKPLQFYIVLMFWNLILLLCNVCPMWWQMFANCWIFVWIAFNKNGAEWKGEVVKDLSVGILGCNTRWTCRSILSPSSA